MLKIGFFCMTQKGYVVLKNFISTFGRDKINYVISNRDNNVSIDYYDQIHTICTDNNILFYNKNEIDSSSLDEDYKIAISWRWIIPSYKNLIVFHDSLLPKYRGFSPLVNMLVNGEKKIGVTALFASKEYDRGDLLAQRYIDINYPIKILKAINDISILYSNMVVDIYKKLSDNNIIPVKQDERSASYSIWLDENDYYIDWYWDAEKIKRFIDAVGHPYDGAKSFINDKVYYIFDAIIIEDVFIEDRKRHIGKVIFFKDSKPVVICGKGLLLLNDIRDQENNITNIKFRSRFTCKMYHH